MGDSRRFHVFSNMIAEHVSPLAAVADVAGGKGYLQAALRTTHGFVNVTSWDKRHKYAANKRGYRFGWFTHDAKEQYSAVVAMHPDGGTDHAILYAARNRCIALVCPCCAVPSAAAYWGSKVNFTEWYEHLKQLGINHEMDVEERKLKIDGRNLVLVFTPKQGAPS